MSSHKKRDRKPATTSLETIEAALRSETEGRIELPAEELARFTTAIAARHENVLRLRNDLPLSFVTELNRNHDAHPVPWYPLAVTSPVSIPVSISTAITSNAANNLRIATRPSRAIDYAAGEYYLQDAGSLLALAAAGADTAALRGQLICDLCAAPGGKASGLLEAIDQPLAAESSSHSRTPRGFLLANEPIRARVAPLAYNLARTGSDQYAITSEDPESLADKFAGIFDFVLVDAPCSGQAMMARGKQSAAAVQAAQIELNARRQNRILRAAERLLRPGGTLVYSTCTFAIEENEAQVRFMIEQLALQAAPVQRLANHRSEILDAPSAEAASCSYRVWPHRDQCAGSFAARVCRPVDHPAQEIETDRDLKEVSWRRSTTSRSRDESTIPSDAVGQLPFLIRTDDRRHRLQLRDWIIDAHAADAPDWVSEPFVIGPELAHRTGSTWKPSHAAALRRTAAIDGVPSLAVDDVVAEQYLSGQTIAAAGDSGWQIVRHAGRPLGWIKGDGRIGKNHLARFART